MLKVRDDSEHVPTCLQCKKKFASYQMLEKHRKNKIPCDRVIKCEKCEKIFKHLGHLTRHRQRKTTCEPIHGDPTIETDDTTCIYCRRVFKSKYNVAAHHTVCRIKNGGMQMLFKKLAEQQRCIEALQKKTGVVPVNQGVVNNIVNNNSNNTVNNTINIPLICFGSDEQRDRMIEIIKENLHILHRPALADVPPQEQVCARIGEFITAIYRNPAHTDMQGIYTDGTETKDTGNVFTFSGDKWHVGDWRLVSKDVMSRIFHCYSDIKKRLLQNRDPIKADVMHTMRAIFQASGTNPGNISEENMRELYHEIGLRLTRDSMLLE